MCAMVAPRIAVIGAGIGGLTLGLALRARGIDAQIYERAGELREVGAAIALAANGTRILTRLGLGDELAAVSEVPTELIFRHWSDGRVLARHPVGAGYLERFGGSYWGIHRSDLQRVLCAAWGEPALHLSRGVEQLDTGPDGVRLRFADGTETTADVVVGADGVRSTVRSWVEPGSAPIYSGTSGFRGLAPMDALGSLPDPGAIQFWAGPGMHLLHYRIGPVVNFLAVVDGPARWNGLDATGPAAPGELASHFDGWHPAVLEMLHAVPQSPRWGLFTLPPLLRWSRDGVVLLGDAAHAMVPHHGQGANQTIEDAAVLAGCLADWVDGGAPGTHLDALDRYSRLRRARTRAVQRASWDTSAALHLPDGDQADARDARLRDLPAALAWIHGYDPRGCSGLLVNRSTG
jgi:salicylate hydroxylase